MKRKCERCQYDISTSYLLEQDSFSKIRCPNCGRELEAVFVSKVLTYGYAILFFIVFCILPMGLFLTLIIEYVWMIFSCFYLPAFLYLYKEKNEDEDEDEDDLDE